MTNVLAALQCTGNLQNAFIPKWKQIFEINVLPLKLKIVLKETLFILNQYMDLFLKGILSLNNSHVIVVICFHFRSFNDSLKLETSIHSPHIFDNFKLNRRQVQVRLLQSSLQLHLINLSRPVGAASLLV